MRRALGRTWLRAFGWSTHGSPPVVPKAVFVAAPHTSNWDLPFTLATAWALGVNVSWVGKRSLFRFPLGGVMRALGGIPVDRARGTSFVRRTAEVIREHERLYVLIAPSGTRSHRDRWKSGFYHLAREAEVPVLLGFLDYGRKRAGVGPLVSPDGDVRGDMDLIRAFYRDIAGKHPEKASTPRLDEEDAR